MESMQEALQQAGVVDSQGTTNMQRGGQSSETNVGETERWASAIGGGALAVYGVSRLLSGG